MPNSLFFDVFLSFLGGIAGGCGCYVALHWSHMRFQLGLDYRLSDLEGRVGREVKIRAAETHVRKRAKEEDLFAEIHEQAKQPTVTLESWKQSAFKR